MKKQNKQSNLTNSLCIISGTTGGILLTFRELIVQSKLMNTEISLLLPAILILNSIATLLLNYLKTGTALAFSSTESKKTKSSTIESSRTRSSTLQHIGGRKDGTVFQVEHKLLKNLETKLMTNLSDNLLATIAEKYSDTTQKQVEARQQQQQFQRINDRLVKEIEYLARKANLNLVIGVLTTIIAVIILSSTVMKANQQLNNTELFAYYIPRVTLSIFIEMFSFFFLRLYKAGLNEIKYFQNELTTVELKFIAIEKAMSSNKDEIISLVIHELVTTERNFKLAPGESTVELEKQKNEQSNNKVLLESITNLIKTKT